MANGVFQGNATLWQQAYYAGEAAFIGTGVVLVGVPAVGEAAISPAGDFLFSRGTGLLNSNDYIRLGWAWYSYTTTGLQYGGFTYFGLRIWTWHVWGP